MLIDTLKAMGDENRYHPVREYLDSLKWDKTARISNWLTTYCGVEDTPYSRAVGRIWLLAAVRRIRQPGVKFDQMLVFEGFRQGEGKSTVGAILANNEWFTDDLPIDALLCTSDTPQK